MTTTSRIPSFKLIVTTAVLSAAAILPGTTAALAGAPFSEYSCKELWHERNGIYANNGYCFQSPSTIAIFGKGCFAPYGQLSKSEQSTVSEISKWEAIKGCN